MPHSLLSLKKPYLLLPLLLLVLFLPVIPAAAQKKPPGGKPQTQQKTTLTLSWDGTPGVNRYRLQISLDAQFADLVFDRAVEGHEYVITDLPLGHYYWRVAPAAEETGTFSKPRTIDIKGPRAESTVVETTAAKQPSKTGWAAATGSIAHPLALALREQGATDVLGVNSDGMVFALDATNGVALWTARFRPDAKRGEQTGNGGAAPFQPVALPAAGGLQNVLVAYEGGVRTIEGATGRELWRVSLPGRAASGAVGDVDGNGTREIIVFEDNPAGFSLLDAATGHVLAQENLASPVTGAPVAYNSKTESGFLMALADGTLDLRNMKGERLRSTKVEVQFTTPPLIVQTPQSTLAMIGTDHGLVAVDVATMKPLWRVATEGDAPRGQLASADLDNDGAPEVVMITRRGRTVVVSTVSGKIKWYANIMNRAGNVILADLNGDGLTDVLVASDLSTVVGHDGRNGALIFGDEKGVINTAGSAVDENASYQTCAFLQARGSSLTAPLIVCNDSTMGGLRADGLPSTK